MIFTSLHPTVSCQGLLEARGEKTQSMWSAEVSLTGHRGKQVENGRVNLEKQTETIHLSPPLLSLGIFKVPQ